MIFRRDLYLIIVTFLSVLYVCLSLGTTENIHSNTSQVRETCLEYIYLMLFFLASHFLMGLLGSLKRTKNIKIIKWLNQRIGDKRNNYSSEIELKSIKNCIVFDDLLKLILEKSNLKEGMVIYLWDKYLKPPSLNVYSLDFKSDVYNIDEFYKDPYLQLIVVTKKILEDFKVDNILHYGEQ